jgi:hypothetical protein
MSLNAVAYELVFANRRKRMSRSIAAVGSSFLSSQQHCGVLQNVSRNRIRRESNRCKSDQWQRTCLWFVRNHYNRKSKKVFGERVRWKGFSRSSAFFVASERESVQQTSG